MMVDGSSYVKLVLRRLKVCLVFRLPASVGIFRVALTQATTQTPSPPTHRWVPFSWFQERKPHASPSEVISTSAPLPYLSDLSWKTFISPFICGNQSESETLLICWTNKVENQFVWLYGYLLISVHLNFIFRTATHLSHYGIMFSLQMWTNLILSSALLVTITELHREWCIVLFSGNVTFMESKKKMEKRSTVSHILFIEPHRYTASKQRP